MKEIETIIKQLKDNNLLNEKTLIMINTDNQKVIYDYQGFVVNSDLFTYINDKYALFTFGKYSVNYVLNNRKLRLSTDDAAQIFGRALKIKKGKIKGNALLENEGFVVTGRFVSELIASAIIVEKLAKTELTCKSIGKPVYLNSILCWLEHLVYKYSYAKKG